MNVNTCKQNKIVWNVDSTIMKTTQLRQKSECDCFYHVAMISPDDNEKCVAVVDPILMLFNQERLSKLGADTVESWLKSMEQSSNSSYNKLLSECSDDDLLSLVKSRHLQQPSELSAWIDYMGTHMDKFKELYASEMADIEALKIKDIDMSKSE